MSSRFRILETPLDAVKLIERTPMGDRRGYLERMFCTNDLAALMDGRSIVQINRTLTSQRATVRGMHFQYPPHAETKIVSCLRGEVFDVAVDLRSASPTYLRWHGEILSADNHRTMLIPEGFAHGFQTLTDDCELLYLHTAAWNASAEGGLNPRDPRLAIEWPLPISEISDRDDAHPMLTQGPGALAI